MGAGPPRRHSCAGRPLPAVPRTLADALGHAPAEHGPGPVASGRLTFVVRAVDGSGRLVATGEIDRAVVDRQRFLARASAPAAEG